MRILVVDDEALHRRGFCNLLRGIDSSFVVDSAEDGANALEKITKCRYDVIFTDVKMPVLNGIDLAGKIDTRDIKVVIVSGYGEFEYAQQALRIGVFDYLLKPVSKKKVLQVLDKVTACIQEQNSLTKQKKLLEDKMDLTLPVYMQNLLTMLIRGNLHNSGFFSEMSEIIPSVKCGGVLLFKIDGWPRALAGGESALELGGAVRQTLKEYGKFISFQPIDEPAAAHCRLVTLYFGESDMKLYQKENRERLSFKLRGLEKALGGGISLGIGQPVEDMLAQGKRAYGSALSALEYAFYDARKTVVFHDEVPGPFTDTPQYPHTLCANIQNALFLNSPADREESVDRLMDGILQTGLVYPAVLKRELLRNCTQLIAGARHYLSAKEYESLLQSTTERLEKVESYGALRAQVQACALNLEAVYRAAEASAAPRLKKALDYIEENLCGDINLEAAAELSGLNKTYFSHLFKTALGVKFSDYVTRKRIELAQKYLLETDMKAYEIALQAGYRSPEYFTRAFKKSMGLSPEDYRRAHGR